MSLSRNLTFIIVTASLFALFPSLSLYAGSHEKPVTKQAPTFVSMPGPGEKVPIGNGNYMMYGFVEKPKMGSIIMKIQVFNDKGEKDRSIAITADSGMPSMPSMGTDHYAFQLSKKGDYLVPINISMPGDWEIKLTLVKDSKVIYRGSYRFDV
jgi:hypothetical protein